MLTDDRHHTLYLALPWKTITLYFLSILTVNTSSTSFWVFFQIVFFTFAFHQHQQRQPRGIQQHNFTTKRLHLLWKRPGMIPPPSQLHRRRARERKRELQRAARRVSPARPGQHGRTAPPQAATRLCSGDGGGGGATGGILGPYQPGEECCMWTPVCSRVSASAKRKHKTQAANASTKRKHITQAQNANTSTHGMFFFCYSAQATSTRARNRLLSRTFFFFSP